MDAFLVLFLGLMLWMTVSVSKHFLSYFKNYHIGALVVISFCVCLMIPEWDTVVDLFWWNAILRIEGAKSRGNVSVSFVYRHSNNCQSM